MTVVDKGQTALGNCHNVVSQSVHRIGRTADELKDKVVEWDPEHSMESAIDAVELVTRRGSVSRTCNEADCGLASRSDADPLPRKGF